ncbi:ATP-grasp domain-containing protein [Mycolicibacterium sp.]|uniref:carboxylate--amine ligase n=1 Tax=Mycolicibacterium sp. TaxID=2320850 RepID=UPI0025CCB195|nr:ATP-grasp domain-containing protein [Mycolicibacterium sp.]
MGRDRERWTNLILRPDRSRPGPDLDTEVPAVVLWVTPFPLQHNCLGVFRTLGRAGVPVYAVVADPQAPVAKSRYLRGQILWQPHSGEGYDALLNRLMDFGRTMGRRSVIVCTSDEMAVFVARRRAVLEEWFLIPDIAPTLPAELADKQSLEEICHRTSTPIPPSVAVDTMAQLDAVVDVIDIPVMVKSTALRGQVQSVENSTLVRTREELITMARNWAEPYQVLLQKFLPDEHCEDWFTHGYCDETTRADVVFTGRKIRTWPAHGGATAAAYTAADPELAMLARQFCARVGYRGIFDMDWRLDRSTGWYYLLDFNPRVGAQFRMFEDDAGIDVVRALHLDLSGRPIPAGSQINGERFIVEPWDLACILSTRRHPLDGLGGQGRPKAAWLATDDLSPIAAVALTQVRQSLSARARGFFRVPDR